MPSLHKVLKLQASGGVRGGGGCSHGRFLARGAHSNQTPSSSSQHRHQHQHQELSHARRFDRTSSSCSTSSSCLPTNLRPASASAAAAAAGGRGGELPDGRNGNFSSSRPSSSSCFSGHGGTSTSPRTWRPPSEGRDLEWRSGIPVPVPARVMLESTSMGSSRPKQQQEEEDVDVVSDRSRVVEARNALSPLGQEVWREQRRWRALRAAAAAASNSLHEKGQQVQQRRQGQGQGNWHDNFERIVSSLGEFSTASVEMYGGKENLGVARKPWGGARARAGGGGGGGFRDLWRAEEGNVEKIGRVAGGGVGINEYLECQPRINIPRAAAAAAAAPIDGQASGNHFLRDRRRIAAPLQGFCTTARAVHNVSLAGEGGSSDRQISSESRRHSDQAVSDRTPLKLLSGACNLPHPDKAKSGGEDAYFICADKYAFGVADGVGGWSDLGIDAGEYARELMSQAMIAVVQDPSGSVDPADVLEKAHSLTKCRGSSTACILALTDSSLEAANLGDSGFVVVRNSRTVFKSPSQQHQFNIPFQLENGGSDHPSSAQLFSLRVSDGDVIIAGTDGLFDNLYDTELITLVVQAGRGHVGPQVTAERIASLARSRAQDKNRQTPFSAAAQDAGFRFYGGKMDDITVIVSHITSSKSTSTGV